MNSDPVVQIGGGAVLVVVDAVGVELEGLLRGVDGHGHGPDRGHGRQQPALLALRHVHQPHVLRARAARVVPAHHTRSLARARLDREPDAP